MSTLKRQAWVVYNMYIWIIFTKVEEATTSKYWKWRVLTVLIFWFYKSGWWWQVSQKCFRWTREFLAEFYDSTKLLSPQGSFLTQVFIRASNVERTQWEKYSLCFLNSSFSINSHLPLKPIWNLVQWINRTRLNFVKTEFNLWCGEI